MKLKRSFSHVMKIIKSTFISNGESSVLPARTFFDSLPGLSSLRHWMTQGRQGAMNMSASTSGIGTTPEGTAVWIQTEMKSATSPSLNDLEGWSCPSREIDSHLSCSNSHEREDENVASKSLKDSVICVPVGGSSPESVLSHIDTPLVSSEDFMPCSPLHGIAPSTDFDPYLAPAAVPTSLPPPLLAPFGFSFKPKDLRMLAKAQKDMIRKEIMEYLSLKPPSRVLTFPEDNLRDSSLTKSPVGKGKGLPESTRRRKKVVHIVKTEEMSESSLSIFESDSHPSSSVSTDSLAQDLSGNINALTQSSSLPSTIGTGISVGSFLSNSCLPSPPRKDTGLLDAFIPSLSTEKTWVEDMESIESDFNRASVVPRVVDENKDVIQNRYIKPGVNTIPFPRLSPSPPRYCGGLPLRSQNVTTRRAVRCQVIAKPVSAELTMERAGRRTSKSLDSLLGLYLNR